MSRSKDKKPAARVLIVDDHPAVREALAFRIGRQPDMEVCGEAADMSEALRLVADTHPDLAVVDISLKTANGIALIKRIKDRNDSVRILACPPSRCVRLHQQGRSYRPDHGRHSASIRRESVPE